MANLTKETYSHKSRFLGTLRNKYRSIAAEDRNTPEAKKVFKHIIDLDKELKAIDHSTGITYVNGPYPK